MSLCHLRTEFDQMLADSDAEFVAELKFDIATYAARLASGNKSGCLEIEQKYGLFGMSPEQVSEQLHQMTQGDAT